MERWRLTMVEMAITWSASVAWRIPRKNPSASSEKVVPKGGNPADIPGWFSRRDEATLAPWLRQASS
jgi:hypothetical protein